MKNIAWDDQYLIHFPEIDFQHKHFIELLSRIQQAGVREEKSEIGKLLIDELVKFCSFHFQNEENLMLISSYPHLTRHKGEHDKMFKTLLEKIDQVLGLKESPESLVDYLLQWFEEHSKKDDQELGTHLIGAQIYGRKSK